LVAGVYYLEIGHLALHVTAGLLVLGHTQPGASLCTTRTTSAARQQHYQQDPDCALHHRIPAEKISQFILRALHLTEHTYIL
jgi:hypothetical protein